MSESVLRIVIDSRNAERNARNLSRELNSIEKSGDFATKSMDSMSVATRQLAGYMAGIVTVGAAISKMDTYTGINNKLKLVTTSQTELNIAMQDTFAIAQRSAASWTAVNDVYSKYLSNAKTLNLTQEQTAKLTEITSKAVSMSGSSTESAAGALFQYGQALDGNILRGEEYNALVDGAGGLLNAMATGLNVTRGELRQMMLDGKLTGEVITKALLKAGDSVEELYGKTDFRISQEFTRLSNEVTKFVGEAGKGSGAASMLGGSIRLLADNLDSIASIAMLGGVALLTKTIIAQTIAVRGAITESVAKRVALTAEIASQVQLAAVEVQRTRQIASLAAQELRMAQLALVNAKNKDAQAIATVRLAQAEVAYGLAIKQSSVATAAQTVAENALNASRSRGAMLLGLVGGPIGAITLGVTALAAGYMYLSSRTAEANAKLEEQGKVANIATEELLKLEGAKKGQAKTDLAESFNAENQKLKSLNTEIGNYIAKLSSKNTADAETAEILLKVRTGTMTYDEALKKLNKSHADQPDIITKMEDAIAKYKESAVVAQNNADKQKAMGTEVKLAGNAAQNATSQIRNKANATSDDAAASRDAAQANREYTTSLGNRLWNEQFKNSVMIQHNRTQEKANLLLEAYRENEKAGIKGVTVEQKKLIAGIVAQGEALDARNAKERENTKELKKQQKVLEFNSQVKANAAKYNFAGLESKYSLPSGTLSSIHAIETGNTGKTNQVNKQTGATGGFQFLSGTAKQYGVQDRTNMAQSAEGAAKYVSYLLKLFKGDLEKAVRAYHAGEGNVQKGKNIGKYNNDYWKKYQGYMAGGNGYSSGDLGAKEWEKQLEEVAKVAKQQADLRKSLELDVANEVTRIRENLKSKLEEVDNAGFSDSRAKEVKAKLQAQADSEVAIAEYALKSKLDDYENFKKTESQLLKDSFDEKKFYASQDVELSANQKDQAIQFLDEQYQYEIALIELAKEERIFQMQQGLLNANVASEKYWDLERQRIALSTQDLAERNRKLAIANELQAEEKRSNLNNAVQQWGRTQADMTGTGEQFQLEQTKQDRFGESQGLFDAQMALAETAAQREEIWQAHHDRMSMIEADYYTNSQALQLAGMGQVASGLSSIVSDMAGEQSSAHNAMFAIEKGFAIAQSALAIQTGVSKAIALGFPQNIPVIAQTVMEGAKIASAIRAITDTGFADGGFTGHGGKYEPAGVVHKGEGVLTQEEVKAIGGPQGFEDLRKSIRRGYATGGLVTDAHRVGIGAVSAINSGGGNSSSSGDVNITVHVTDSGVTTQSNQADQKQLGQMIGNAVRTVIRQEQRQGGLLSR